MEQLPKIVVSPVADQNLEEMRKIVNEGFTSGRVTKSQLVSWIITHFRNGYFSKQMEKIRADHFDEIAHLKAVVKQMEEARGSNTNVELHDLLSPLLQKPRANPRTNP
jgi:hypothetical protein